MNAFLKQHFFLTLSLLLFLSCNAQTKNPTVVEKNEKTYSDILQERIQDFVNKDYAELGQMLDEFDFKVKTDNIEDYEDGYIPWASLSNPTADVPNLYNKDEIIIKYPVIKVVIDYPVTDLYEFTLKSSNGFTRAQLFTEISKHYHLMYEEEEKTATIKTIPIDQRTELYNRNQTNGKYGLWGHDIADMDIAGVMVFKNKKGEIVIVPRIEA